MKNCNKVNVLNDVVFLVEKEPEALKSVEAIDQMCGKVEVVWDEIKKMMRAVDVQWMKCHVSKRHNEFVEDCSML